MSNGFVYHIVQRNFYLETAVNGWLADQLIANFGDLPATLKPSDLGLLLVIVSEMHERNRLDVQPIIDQLIQGNTIIIDRDY